MPTKQTFYTSIDGGFCRTEDIKILSLSVCHNRRYTDKSALLRGR